MDLKKMNDDDSDKIDPQLIGSLMYLVNTRSGSCYAVNVLSQSMIQPRQTHWITIKHVLRYIWGIVGYDLRFSSSVDLSLQGYVDTYWAESTVDCKRTFGCCFTLEFSMVSWCSRKQRYAALSTTEAEYIALSVVVRESVWLCKLLTYLFDHEMDPAIIHCDNQSFLNLSENPVFHDRSKHIEIK